MARILAFDYGRARIGVAVSDERQIICSPAFVIKVEKSMSLTIKSIKEKARAYGSVELLVVGLPLLLSGKEGDMALEAKAFADALSKEFGLPVIMWDERLTSTMADRLMKEDDRSRKERAKASDTLSATLILQNYLDMKHLKNKKN